MVNNITINFLNSINLSFARYHYLQTDSWIQVSHGYDGYPVPRKTGWDIKNWNQKSIYYYSVLHHLVLLCPMGGTGNPQLPSTSADLEQLFWLHTNSSWCLSGLSGRFNASWFLVCHIFVCLAGSNPSHGMEISSFHLKFGWPRTLNHLSELWS